MPGRQARARSRSSSSSSSQQQRGADNSVGTARPHTTPYAPECVNDGGREGEEGARKVVCALVSVCSGEKVALRCDLVRNRSVGAGREGAVCFPVDSINVQVAAGHAPQSPSCRSMSVQDAAIVAIDRQEMSTLAVVFEMRRGVD